MKDKWGLPVMRFHWKWSDHELRQVKHMQRTFSDLISAMGGKPNAFPEDPLKSIRAGGNVKHEVGGAIMGHDPRTSVTTPFGRT